VEEEAVVAAATTANNNSGRGNCNNDKDFKATNKKTLEDYYFHVGSAKQASNYKSAADFIINHIKKEYDSGQDIAESLPQLRNPIPAPGCPN
jgi:hypothetical protein